MRKRHHLIVVVSLHIRIQVTTAPYCLFVIILSLLLLLLQWLNGTIDVSLNDEAIRTTLDNRVDGIVVVAHREEAAFLAVVALTVQITRLHVVECRVEVRNVLLLVLQQQTLVVVNR